VNILTIRRICAVRKSETAIESAQQRLRQKASKKQTTLRPETLEYAKYVIVFTTWRTTPANQILDWGPPHRICAARQEIQGTMAGDKLPAVVRR
jgi:hypothetical protein